MLFKLEEGLSTQPRSKSGCDMICSAKSIGNDEIVCGQSRVENWGNSNRLEVEHLRQELGQPSISNLCLKNGVNHYGVDTNFSQLCHT
jgi:hypothetical protein